VILILINPNEAKRQTQIFLNDTWWYNELTPESISTVFIQSYMEQADVKKEKEVTNMGTKKKRTKEITLAYLLLLPACTSAVIFSFYPFFKTIISSFSITDEFGGWLGWAGMRFWKMMVEIKTLDFWLMIRTTLIFAVMNFTMTVGMAMFLSLITTKQTKQSKIYQTLFALPMAVASATASVMWKFIFNSEGGLMNSWLHMDIDWLNSPEIAIWAVAIVTSWCHMGHTYMLLLAGFRGVSQDVQEAAIVDGAGGFARAIRIMIPMASPQIFYVVFINIISSLKTFTQINLMTSGGPACSTTTLMYGIYMRMRSGEYEAACCLSLVLFVVIFVITRIQLLFEKKTVHYQ